MPATEICETQQVKKGCSECGHPVGMHSRDFRFQLPDEFSDWPDDRLASETSTNGTFMRVTPESFFVRSTLPIRLRGSHVVACGVWLSITSVVLHEQLVPSWDGPDYTSLTFTARLANALPPWPGHFVGSEVSTEVRQLDELPYVVRSSDPELQKVLESEWEHRLVLDSFG